MRNVTLGVLGSGIILLGVVVVFGIFLINTYADVPEVTVTIEYNIATIIVALLGGSGIAIFSGTYAISKFMGKDVGKKSE